LLCSVEEFLFRALDIQDAIIDGAIVALDEKGRS
jgi:ATP-dependent DNA ligase